MAKEYIDVDLTQAEKAAVLQYAGFFVVDETTKTDLSNNRKKWIRFGKFALSDIIGELSYCFNRCEDNDLFQCLDELISHLEYYECKVKG